MRQWDRLTRVQQEQFKIAVAKFVTDLRAGTLRPSLRVRGYEGAAGVFELTWAPDGRALFRYGDPALPGEPHIIWLRIGTHDIFDEL